MTGPTDTVWIAEGSKVAIYAHGNRSDSVSIATVEKLTKTQVVLDGDRRFRRDNLREVGGGQRGAWDPLPTELMRLDDPRVIDVRAGQRVRGLARAVERAAAGRISTLETALSALASIEAEVRRTRAAFDQLLVNGAGTPQTDEDMANAQRVAEGR